MGVIIQKMGHFQKTTIGSWKDHFDLKPKCVCAFRLVAEKI